ncbi:MAG TPA: NADH-quinone oxidoreductase subunit NuoK [Armatimonadota bacterium]|nr:NADH-quinone oxidoreductase subunit NuoK [Armatimonadota bacterium]
MPNLALQSFLVVAAGLFCIGVYGVLTRRNAVAILMSIELMLNAANINLIAFARYTDGRLMAGQAFSIFVITVAAAEAAVGLAVVMCIYRNIQNINVDDIDLLRW